MTVLFDINDHKSNLEKMISEQANIDFKILGDLSLDLGFKTKIKAKQLSVKKNNILILESEEFNAYVSVSKILTGRFDMDSLSLVDSKLYGLNIDESIIKSYNLLTGINYYIDNTMYSNIELIETKGYFQDEILQIKDIRLKTELLEGEGFGKINSLKETVNISVSTKIRTNESIKKKYNKYYPKYLIETELPVLISGNYNSPEIDIKISDIITKRLKEEIKTKAIKTIKDKIQDKIKSEINIKLPF
tara:strand:- start:978 stop:1718 length:741 start_codon:yes stop_codon:yes gene_type:complete